MIYQIFAVRDTAVGAFLVPMFFRSEPEAVRAFGDEVRRPADGNMLAKHPEHFQLYHCGSYDDSEGLISTKPPEFVVSAQSLTGG